MANLPIVNCWETVALARGPSDASHHVFAKKHNIFVKKKLRYFQKEASVNMVNSYHLLFIFFQLHHLIKMSFIPMTSGSLGKWCPPGMHAPPRPTPQKGGFAPPCENYQNLRGAAGQSWFQSIEIRKAITRKDPILSNKYLPHSQISWFTHFFAPPQMKCKTRKYFKYFIYILVFPLHGHVTLKNANYYFQDYRNQN